VFIASATVDETLDHLKSLIICELARGMFAEIG
jgi:hypothetical protein